MNISFNLNPSNYTDAASANAYSIREKNVTKRLCNKYFLDLIYYNIRSGSPWLTKARYVCRQLLVILILSKILLTQ